jgi:hypothetical protein
MLKLSKMSQSLEVLSVNLSLTKASPQKMRYFENQSPFFSQNKRTNEFLPQPLKEQKT